MVSEKFTHTRTDGEGVVGSRSGVRQLTPHPPSPPSLAELKTDGMPITIASISWLMFYENFYPWSLCQRSAWLKTSACTLNLANPTKQKPLSAVAHENDALSDSYQCYCVEIAVNKSFGSLTSLINKDIVASPQHFPATTNIMDSRRKTEVGTQPTIRIRGCALSPAPWMT